MLLWMMMEEEEGILIAARKPQLPVDRRVLTSYRKITSPPAAMNGAIIEASSDDDSSSDSDEDQDLPLRSTKKWWKGHWKRVGAAKSQSQSSGNVGSKQATGWPMKFGVLQSLQHRMTPVRGWLQLFADLGLSNWIVKSCRALGMNKPYSNPMASYSTCSVLRM